MSDVAVYASTVAVAVQLAQTRDRSAETTRQAASVAAVALDLASPGGREALELELRAAGELGDGPRQFPGSPWVLWQNDRIFRLLKTADMDERAAAAMRGLTVERLLEMTPTGILAMLGAPHRPIWLPRWAAAAAVGLVVGGALAALIRAQRAEDVWHD